MVLPCLLAVSSALLEFALGDFMRLGLVESLAELTGRAELVSSWADLDGDAAAAAAVVIEANGTASAGASGLAADWGRFGGAGTSVALWFVYKFVLTAALMSAPIPCGVLMPAMALGAGAGRLYGMVLTVAGLSTWPTSDFAVAGAAAFAGGVTGTISIAVIVFELTNQLHFALPLLAATLLARYAASAASEPFYDVMLRLAQLPAPPSLALAGMTAVPLQHVMGGCDHALPRKIGTAELAQVRCYISGVRRVTTAVS